MSEDKPTNSILLDLTEQIGALNAYMIEARHSRERVERSLESVKEDISEIKPVVAIVKEMKPEHDDLMKFRDRIGSYVWVGWAVVSGAAYLLWHGLAYFSDAIKKALGFH